MWFSKGSPPTSSTASPGNMIKIQIPPLPYPTQNRKLWNGPATCVFTSALGDTDIY